MILLEFIIKYTPIEKPFYTYIDVNRVSQGLKRANLSWRSCRETPAFLLLLLLERVGLVERGVLIGTAACVDLVLGVDPSLAYRVYG
jgi:hypothetical protein